MKKKDKKWHVYATVTGGKYLGTIMAPTREAAEEAAWDMDNAFANLCHQCSTECEDAEISKISVEEEDNDK